jgi:hypothetical protein
MVNHCTLLLDIVSHYSRFNLVLINFCNFGHCNLEFFIGRGCHPLAICDLEFLIFIFFSLHFLFVLLRVLRGFVASWLNFS